MLQNLSIFCPGISTLGSSRGMGCPAIETYTYYYYAFASYCVMCADVLVWCVVCGMLFLCEVLGGKATTFDRGEQNSSLHAAKQLLHLLICKAQTQTIKQQVTIWALMQCRRPNYNWFFFLPILAQPGLNGSKYAKCWKTMRITNASCANWTQQWGSAGDLNNQWDGWSYQGWKLIRSPPYPAINLQLIFWLLYDVPLQCSRWSLTRQLSNQRYLGAYVVD